MSNGLRRKLTSYGDQGFSLFLRKAFIKAMGYSDDALDRPIVGIANTYSDYNPCHGNVPQLIEAVKRGVMLNGALPMVFPTISIHESFASPTSMYLRNLMAMETEEMIRAQPMDSVVLIGGCDKTLPAQIMAAASSEIPAIFLPTGPMATGHHKGERLGACTDCRRMWGRFRAGEIDEAEIIEVNNKLVSSVGTCTVMGTASTMANLTEVMGLCLPKAGSAPATDSERMRLAEATGAAAAKLAANGGMTVRELLTPASHPQCPGRAAGHGRLDQCRGPPGRHLRPPRASSSIMAELDDLGQRVPLLVDLQPSGQHYMAEFHKAGGVPRFAQGSPRRTRSHRAHRLWRQHRRCGRCRHRRARPDHHPHHRGPAQADRHARRAQGQPHPARRRHQAIRGLQNPDAAYRPRRGVRQCRGHDQPHRQRRSRRHRR